MYDDPNQYTEQGFWDKVNKVAKAAGQELVEKALQLYYTARDSQTPVWAKTLIYGALAYLIAPLDMIPDFIPVAGFTDDLGVLISAVAAIAMHITPEVKKQADKKMVEWFD